MQVGQDLGDILLEIGEAPEVLGAGVGRAHKLLAKFIDQHKLTLTNSPMLIFFKHFFNSGQYERKVCHTDTPFHGANLCHKSGFEFIP
jgi:hypothetical protein